MYAHTSSDEPATSLTISGRPSTTAADKYQFVEYRHEQAHDGFEEHAIRISHEKPPKACAQLLLCYLPLAHTSVTQRP